MQKIALSILTIALLGFIACNQDNALTPGATTASITVPPVTCPEGIEINEDALPQSILEAIANNYPNIDIDEITLLDDNGTPNYGVELENGTQILFDADGNILSQGVENEIDLDVNNLSASITDYVATNYPGVAIEEAEQEDQFGTTYIEVELANNTELIFDADGNYLCTEEDDDNNGGGDDDDDGGSNHDDNGGSDDDDNGGSDDDNGGDDDDDGGNSDDDNGGSSDDDNDNDDDFSNLPQIVQDYINANFSGYSLEGAEMITACDNSTLLEVELENAQGMDVTLAFDLTGNQVYTATKILAIDLPAEVTTSIAASYAIYTVENKAAQVEFANGDIQYVVSLEGPNGQDDLKVWIDPSGLVICEKED